MKKISIGLLPRILIAIVLGIVLGNVLTAPLVRIFVTFNAIFSPFLNFLIPLLIVGLVTPAIADIGRGAGKLLLTTVVIAYVDTVFAGLLAYGTGSWLFPSMVSATQSGAAPPSGADLKPYFSLNIPPMFDVMSALVFAFVFGLAIAYSSLPTLKSFFCDFREVIVKTINVAIIPLLPLYIFGIFLNMTYSGKAYRMMVVFAQIIVVIFILHILILVYQYLLAGGIVRRNPFRTLWNMLPAYLTALGTSSSAATIPVTVRSTLRNKVSNDIAGFVIPLCATIHMSGSCMKITACALTICLLDGLPHDPMLFLNFIMMLGIMMVAAPGVPGGSIMAALAPLAMILGFGKEEQALMIALYIAMDSFGTACNVTGDGAIAMVIDRMFKGRHKDVETLHEA